MHSGKENDKRIILMTIINRGNILKEGLNNNYSFKLVEDGTKLIVDKEKDLKCVDNELYYKTDFKYTKEIKECSCILI